MAKKKSVKQEEVKENAHEQMDESAVETVETDENVLENVETHESVPENVETHEHELENAEPKVSESAEVSLNVSSVDVLKPTNPENDIAALDTLSTTGEIIIDDANYVDPQFLGRLRQAYLTPSNAYREAQVFASQALDLTGLFGSGEPILVHNLIEIFRMSEVWYPISWTGLKNTDPKTREVTERYLLHCLRQQLVSCADMIEDYTAQLEQTDDESRNLIRGFGEKLRSALVNMMAQPQLYDWVQCQQALTRLCNVLDNRTVGRMLYDPSPAVRIAVIRALMMRPALDINDLSVALILLKDRDEQVDTALMRLFAKFASCPELVIPQLLVSWTTASDSLKAEISDVFRSYGNEAVAPLMAALDDPRHEIYQAVCSFIAQVPPRYTDALLNKVRHFRTRADVKTRILDILKGHQDPPRRGEISEVLKIMLSPTNDDYPEWKAPDTREKFLKPATENTDIYTGLMDEAAIAAFSETCDDEALGRLLNDASETVQINALRIIRHRGTVPTANDVHVRVWLKSSSPALASEALAAFLAYEKDMDRAVIVVLEAFKHGESDAVKQHYFQVMLAHQPFIDALIRAFYQTPRRCAGLITKLLTLSPTEQTLAGILHGLDRNQSVACIAETMMCLYRAKAKFDNHAIRAELVKHLREPVSFGQHGFQARLYAIKLLGKFLSADETPDRTTISALQAFYKDCKHAELKLDVKTVLKNLGEELFDFDDEDDDFEDLNDEDDDF